MTRKPAKSKHTSSEKKATQSGAEQPISGNVALVKETTLENALYIVSTPIGNLRDITLRALDVLARCDVLLCEDKRVTQKLLNAYTIKSRMMVYHDHNAEKQRPKILDVLQKGQSVALVTDAGTPLISDPGFKLVQAVRQAGFNVIPVPGASAVLAALAGAGVPTDMFTFAGFMPPKKSARQAKLSSMAQYEMTLVFYESANRLNAFLQDVFSTMGNRDVVIAREITKKFEEFIHAPVQDVIVRLQEGKPLKGEVVVMISACQKDQQVNQYDDETLDQMLGEALSSMGMSVRDAAAYVAEETGVQKRKLYARALALSHAGRSDLG